MADDEEPGSYWLPLVGIAMVLVFIYWIWAISGDLAK